MTETKTFGDWLNANYLFDTSNFIKDEADREKVKSSNPTWMAWQHQQQRIDLLLQAAKVAVSDLRELAADCNSNDDAAKRLEAVIKQIEVK